MQPVIPTPATPSIDHSHEDSTNNPVTQPAQAAIASSGGFWGWIDSIISYFTSHSVTQLQSNLRSQPIITSSPQPATCSPQSPLAATQANIDELQSQVEAFNPFFLSYDLVVEFPQGQEQTYSIQKPADELAAIEALEKWVNENFQSVKVKKGIYSEDLCQVIQGSHAKKRAAFTSRFDFHKEDYSLYESLGPKPIAEKVLEDNLKQFRYANGIEEVRRLLNGKWELEIRRYPNEDFEKGHFNSQGVLESGVRFTKGAHEFLSPERLGFQNDIRYKGKSYAFAKIDIGDKNQVALLEKDGAVYRLSQEPPLPILFSEANSPISFFGVKDILDCPISFISPQEIVEYAFGLEYQLPRIFILEETDVLAILKHAQKLQIPFDFHATTPSGETLFSKWAVEGNAELLQCMLEMDPTCIDQTNTQPVSFLRQALISGWGQQNAQLLKSAMEARNIPLSLEDSWIDRIHQGDLSFSDEEFLALDPLFQKELYAAAHACSHLGLIERMNGLGMKQQPLPAQGISLLSINMDLVEQTKAIKNCLLKLRAENRILLPEEAPPNLESFHQNFNDFSRVLGAAFVKETVQRLNLKYVDAPETFAVLKPGTHNIGIEHTRRFPQSTNMDIYAEKIVKVKRFLSLEEASEVLDLIEAIGFGDPHLGNFMITQDKIYLVDLEGDNFQKYAAYNSLGQLADLVKQEDRRAFIENIELRIKAVNEKREEEEDSDFQDKCRRTFYCGINRYEFPVASIIQ